MRIADASLISGMYTGSIGSGKELDRRTGGGQEKSTGSQEATVLGLQGCMKADLAKLEELQTEDKLYYGSFEIDTVVVNKVDMRKQIGEFATNCNQCRITCRHPCSLEDQKLDYDVMDHLLPAETRT